jgi:hypothetical protein
MICAGDLPLAAQVEVVGSPRGLCTRHRLRCHLSRLPACQPPQHPFANIQINNDDFFLFVIYHFIYTYLHAQEEERLQRASRQGLLVHVEGGSRKAVRREELLLEVE